MKRFFVKFFSTVKKSPNPKLNMATAQTRFFKNNEPDFEEGQSAVVPESSVKAAIFNILENIDANVEPTDSNLEENLYVGSAGIAYMYYYLSKQPYLSQYRENFLLKTENYIKPALETAGKNLKRAQNVPGFILGNYGVYAVAAAFYHTVGNNDLCSRYKILFYGAADICKRQNYFSCGSDELFVGRAGYLTGCLWLAQETKSAIRKNDIFVICNIIVASGRTYAKKVRSPSPLMYAYYDVEYLGAAHGVCTILQTLMSVPGYLEEHPKEAKDIKETVDFVLSLQDSEGNFPCATDEIQAGRNELVHWCHGAPGVIYMMAKAFIIWKDNKYLQSCQKAADLVWRKGLLKKGPGICHGIAGNGYVFLLMHRLTGENKYLHRAVTFAKFMDSDEFKQGARIPDNPYSLYEGIAGTACFLNDLLVPNQAAFPFSDVFL